MIISFDRRRAVSRPTNAERAVVATRRAHEVTYMDRHTPGAAALPPDLGRVLDDASSTELAAAFARIDREQLRRIAYFSARAIKDRTFTVRAMRRVSVFKVAA